MRKIHTRPAMKLAKAQQLGSTMLLGLTQFNGFKDVVARI